MVKTKSRILKPIKSHICVRCQKEIKKGEMAVLVRNYSSLPEDKVHSEYYYHNVCWMQFFEECIVQKMKLMQGQVMDIIKKNPDILNMFRNFAQGDL
jgi:hypothetical protein